MYIVIEIENFYILQGRWRKRGEEYQLVEQKTQ